MEGKPKQNGKEVVSNKTLISINKKYINESSPLGIPQKRGALRTEQVHTSSGLPVICKDKQKDCSNIAL